MNYPTFFKNTPTIKLRDPLLKFLGTFQEGELEFSYLDVVKNAGHSCPTVTGAFLMTRKALNQLYTDTELPIRGEISIAFKNDVSEGVTGVISNVISQITGATELTGFKGLNGAFSRHHLMKFNADIKGEVEFTRLDTNKSVSVSYDSSPAPATEKQQTLMKKIIQGEATQQEEIEFEVLWQHRVEKLFRLENEVVTVH